MGRNADRAGNDAFNLWPAFDETNADSRRRQLVFQRQAALREAPSFQGGDDIGLVHAIGGTEIAVHIRVAKFRLKALANANWRTYALSTIKSVQPPLIREPFGAIA